jgi:hypothetical protein
LKILSDNKNVNILNIYSVPNHITQEREPITTNMPRRMYRAGKCQT